MDFISIYMIILVSFIIIPVVCFTIYKVVEQICNYKLEKLKEGRNR